MGIEIECFVYPDRISEGVFSCLIIIRYNINYFSLTHSLPSKIPELICPICHNVVENAVQTPSEHLFCEDELLEWLVQSNLCPVTNTPLDASTIKVCAHDRTILCN